jgi:hypothetical protein
MEAFWSEDDDQLYVVVDMYGFKGAYVSEENDCMVADMESLPVKRILAEEEQALCDEFMADLAKTTPSTSSDVLKVLDLDHNYAFINHEGELDNIIWSYPFTESEDTASLVEYIVGNIMHAGGKFWTCIKRPKFLPAL